MARLSGVRHAYSNRSELSDSVEKRFCRFQIGRGEAFLCSPRLQEGSQIARQSDRQWVHARASRTSSSHGPAGPTKTNGRTAIDARLRSGAAAGVPAIA